MGRLMKKIQRQLATARIKPPSTGPSTLPAPQVTELKPIAFPRSSPGKTSVMIAIELAVSMAPPIPCTTRAPIKKAALGAIPIGIEAHRLPALITWKDLGDDRH